MCDLYPWIICLDTNPSMLYEIDCVSPAPSPSPTAQLNGLGRVMELAIVSPDVVNVDCLSSRVS
jgi:hypothetical protein